VILGSLFAEATSISETRVKVHAVFLSSDNCSLNNSTTLVPEVALSELIAFAAKRFAAVDSSEFTESRSRVVHPNTSISGNSAEQPKNSALIPHGFCHILFERQQFGSVDVLREKAGKRNFAKNAEQVWSAVLLILRQFAVVTISDKKQWRISYTSPCRPPQTEEDGRPEVSRLFQSKPSCIVSIWLEPKGLSTDTFVAFEAKTGEDHIAMREIDAVLDRIATQLFAEIRLRYLIQ